MIFKITADTEIEAKNLDEVLYKIGKYYLNLSLGDNKMPQESIFTGGEIKVERCKIKKNLDIIN